MRRTIFGILVFASMSSVWAQAPADAPKKDDRFAIGTVKFDETAQRLAVNGTTALPEGAILSGVFLRAGNAAGYAKAKVEKGGKFALSFDARGSTFFPGKYAIQISFHPQDQDPKLLEAMGADAAEAPPFSYDMQIGTPEEIAAFAKQAHKKLLGIMHELGRLHGEIYMFCSSTIQRATVQERTVRGPLPDSDRERLYKEMDKVGTADFEMRMRLAARDFKEYRDQVAGGFLPDVEKDIDMLLVVMNNWYAAWWTAVAKKLNLPVPPRIASATTYPIQELDAQTDTITARVYKALEVTDPDEKDLWSNVSVMAPEKGNIDSTGKIYKSYSSKFQIALPSEDWKFDFTPMNPTIRMRILLKDNPAKKILGIAVEIRDFPESKSMEDLDKISEVFAAERWVGYKRLSGKTLRVPDSTMPNSVRPGYEIICLQEDPAGVFHVRDYALYCRWYKRTYCVVCMADPETFKTYAKDFEAACRSFVVLDDPKFKDEKEKEEKRLQGADHEKGGEDHK